MTDLRQAAHNKRVDDVIRVAIAAAWDKLDDKPEQEPTPWRDMVVVSLVREGVNKHKARELADHFAAQPPLPVQRKPLTDKQILADETLRYYFGQNGGAGPVSKQGRRVVDAIEAAHGIEGEA